MISLEDQKISQHYFPKSHIPEKIDEYTRCMIKENLERQSKIVYMDESYMNKNLKKSKLLDECSKQGIKVPDKSIKTKIWKLLEPFIRNTLSIICATTKAEDNEVLFYPLHYSELH